MLYPCVRNFLTLVNYYTSYTCRGSGNGPSDVRKPLSEESGDEETLDSFPHQSYYEFIARETLLICLRLFLLQSPVPT